LFGQLDVGEIHGFLRLHVRKIVLEIVLFLHLLLRIYLLSLLFFRKLLPQNVF
jgi:hypothetical protein